MSKWDGKERRHGPKDRRQREEDRRNAERLSDESVPRRDPDTKGRRQTD
jgi:hypothetical protein